MSKNRAKQKPKRIIPTQNRSGLRKNEKKTVWWWKTKKKKKSACANSRRIKREFFSGRLRDEKYKKKKQTKINARREMLSDMFVNNQSAPIKCIDQRRVRPDAGNTPISS